MDSSETPFLPVQPARPVQPLQPVQPTQPSQPVQPAQSVVEPLYPPQPAPATNNFFSKKTLLIFGIIGVLAIAATVIIITLSNVPKVEAPQAQTTPTTQTEDVPPSEEVLDPEEEGDATEEAETLNALLAEAVKNNPHAAYETKLSDTKYRSITPNELLFTLNLTRAELSKPSSSSRFTKVTAMNSNALNYYLDQGAIVVIVAKGESLFSKNGSSLVVYAADYAFPVYAVFRPSSGSSEAGYVSRSAIFNDIIGLADFYVFLGGNNG